jgi:hypothetical protein
MGRSSSAKVFAKSVRLVCFDGADVKTFRVRCANLQGWETVKIEQRQNPLFADSAFAVLCI